MRAGGSGQFVNIEFTGKIVALPARKAGSFGIHLHGEPDPGGGVEFEKEIPFGRSQRDHHFLVKLNRILKGLFDAQLRIAEALELVCHFGREFVDHVVVHQTEAVDDFIFAVVFGIFFGIGFIPVVLGNLFIITISRSVFGGVLRFGKVLPGGNGVRGRRFFGFRRVLPGCGPVCFRRFLPGCSSFVIGSFAGSGNVFLCGRRFPGGKLHGRVGCFRFRRNIRLLGEGGRQGKQHRDRAQDGDDLPELFLHELSPSSRLPLSHKCRDSFRCPLHLSYIWFVSDVSFHIKTGIRIHRDNNIKKNGLQAFVLDFLEIICAEGCLSIHPLFFNGFKSFSDDYLRIFDSYLHVTLMCRFASFFAPVPCGIVFQKIENLVWCFPVLHYISACNHCL